MSSSPSDIPYTVPLPGGIPETHRPHTERTTTILVPKDDSAFLNPVQEYNRDLSVSVIRAWNDLRKEEFSKRVNAKVERQREKNKKRDAKAAADAEAGKEAAEGQEAAEAPATEAGPSTTPREFKAPKITILEALSATGLRSIRYAKEIPDVKVVLANDLSPSACDAMRRNVALNGVGEDKQQQSEAAVATETEPAPVSEEEAANERDLGRRDGCDGRVRINEGDACALMYSHRAPKDRVHVVDLDPYGTAAPFIDAAVSCIADGGLLCVTCTDLAVLAGFNYPEKCFSNYGGAPVHAEYSHEVALRLILNSLAQAAARYQRYITPLISLSIDFYARLFVRVDSKPVEVKRLHSQTGVVYACTYCQTPTVQPFGKIVERKSPKGHTNLMYRTAAGPPTGAHCGQCDSAQHLAGPMWLGPIHDPDFVSRVLTSIDADKDQYGTWPRMNGMLTIARDELPDPFYFTSNTIFGFASSSAAPTKQVISALLNANYKVSRSHALSGSVKTDAPRSFVFDVVREIIKSHPVRMDKLSPTSPARALVTKEQTHTVDLAQHAGAKQFDRDNKVVYYQLNPLPNWGPGSRAKTVRPKKEKRKSEDGEGEGEVKRVKVAEVDEEAAMNA